MISLLLLLSCGSAEKEKKEKQEPQAFYVGTYTDKDSQGIYKYELSEEGQMKQIGLMAVTENPSFLAKSSDGKYLLAVNEISDENNHGRVESYAISQDSLLLISSQTSGGAHPCFVSTNEEGYVLVANYTGGSMALLKIDEQGALNELDLEQHEGKGTTSRQQGPHAHSAWFAPMNDHIISVDLGTNELWFSTIEEEKLVPVTPQKLAMERGAGPRHLCFHPNHQWIYILNELNGTITQVEVITDGSYQIGSTYTTLASEYAGENYAADIHISSDGRFLYASVRGPNEIAIFKVEEETGKLKLLSHQHSHGDWPRSFSLSPDENFLLVAHQYSDNIACFKRNTETGLLTFVSEAKAPSPVCLLF